MSIQKVIVVYYGKIPFFNANSVAPDMPEKVRQVSGGFGAPPPFVSII